jgi:hypothetical protein
MATATTLSQAAGQAFDNLHIRWLANGLQSVLAAFSATTLPSFPESQPNANPVSNWLTLIAALAQLIPATNAPIQDLTQAAEYVYRLCWVANFLQSTGDITNTQATFLLASYNTIIGF